MRRLTVREKALLCILLVVAIVSGYLALFYQPMTTKMAELEEEIAVVENECLEGQIKVAQMEQMQRELKEMYESGETAVEMPTYDNRQAVMMELNSILSRTSQYSLNFGTVETESVIVKRNIALNFRTRNYEEAKNVLRQLHDSQYRCLLTALSVSEDSSGGGVQTSVTMTFFEYQNIRH